MARVQFLIQQLDSGDAGGLGMFLKKQRPLDTFGRTHQRHRPAFEMRQDQRRGLGVILDQREFGQPGAAVNHSVGVRDAQLSSVWQRGRREAGFHDVLQGCGRFAMHLSGILVHAQTLKHRMAHPPGVCPLGKSHFSHQHRLDPVPFDGGGQICKSRPARAQSGKAGLQSLEGRIVKPGAYVARVLQLSPGVIKPQKQGAQTCACAFWCRVAANHKLLAQLGLELDPGGRPASPVRGVQLFADQALQPQSACRLQQPVGRRGKIFAETHHVQARPVHQLAQDLAALQQGQGPQVIPGVKGQIKNVIHNPGRAGLVKRVLQGAKVRHTVAALHHNFPIQPARAQARF